MPNLQGGFGSFLTRSAAKFEKKFLKTFELILSSKQCSPSVFRQIFEGLSRLEANQVILGFSIILLACQYFHSVLQQRHFSSSFL